MSGMRYLHASSPPICHSDLKSSNVLYEFDFPRCPGSIVMSVGDFIFDRVDRGLRAKVSDFGLAIKRYIC